MVNIKIPRDIKIANGTLRKHRDHGEMEIADPIPQPPDFMNDIAKVEWKRVVELLQPTGVLKATDFGCLSMYCILFAELVTSGGGMRPASLTVMRGLMNDLGLTPKGRGYIKAPDKKKKANSFGALDD